MSHQITLLAGSGDRVAFKLMADALPSYVYFLHQLTMMVYIVAFFLPVILTGRRLHVVCLCDVMCDMM